MSSTKICYNCLQNKSLSEFYKTIIKDILYFNKKCKTCILAECKEKYKPHPKKKNKIPWNHSAEGKEYQRNYRKMYRKLHKNNPNYKLRANLSRTISRALHKEGTAKKSSFLKNLNYDIQELKSHLERQFEPWMTWNNYGVYHAKTWDDNNPSTWTWNIDHILPQSDLVYRTMEDDNFKKCWALENLRPLSAKLNNSIGKKKPGRHSKSTP